MGNFYPDLHGLFLSVQDSCEREPKTAIYRGVAVLQIMTQLYC